MILEMKDRKALCGFSYDKQTNVTKEKDENLTVW